MAVVYACALLALRAWAAAGDGADEDAMEGAAAGSAAAGPADDRAGHVSGPAPADARALLPAGLTQDEQRVR